MYMIDKLRQVWHRAQGLMPFTKIIAGSYVFRKIIYFIDKLNHTWAESQEYFQQNQDRIKNILSHLSDEKSRRVYINMINFRCGHDPKYAPKFVKGIADNNQYFDKGLIQFGDNEVFVDCGAFNGDTIKSFLNNLQGGGGKFKEIIAFEPDPYNYKALTDWVSDLPGDVPRHIKCYNMGTWSKKGILSFEANEGGTSKITQTKRTTVKNDDYESTTISVDTLDNILKDRAVTFIKMDIEGSELPSLKGAEKVISENFPRLTICIYHSDADMLEIPEYVMEKYPEYSLYIRQHAAGLHESETVLYAIPD